MAGTTQQGAARAFRILDTATLPVGTETLVDDVPSDGFGTLRVFCFSQAAGTLKIYQAPRSVNGTSVTYRQTDSRSVTASGTSMTFEFDVVADYVRIDWVPTAGDPTTFEASAHLVP